MSAFEQATQLYKSLLSEYPVNSPIVLTYKTWFQGQFTRQGANHVAMQLERERKSATVSATNAPQFLTGQAGAKPMQKFNHPSAKTGAVQIPKSAGLQNRLNKPTVQPEQPAHNLAEALPPTSTKAPEPTPEQGADVAQVVDTKAFSASEVESIKEMNAKAVLETYGADRVAVHLNKSGVNFNPSKSERQLANLLIEHLKGE